MAFCNLLYVLALLAIVLVISPLQCNGVDLQTCLANLAGQSYRRPGETSTTYDGILSTTVGGLTCQRWDSNSPHSSNYPDPTKYPEGSLTAAENYCRDPSGSGYTWCYTTDPAVRWQKCSVTNCMASECYKAGGKSTTYDGTHSITIKRKICQRWDSQTPHNHSYTDPSKYPESSLTDAENHCRDPSQSGYTWCYTTDSSVRWQPCGVNSCLSEYDPNACYRYNETSKDYRGFIKETFAGVPCQAWSSRAPHDHSYYNQPSKFPENDVNLAGNYCRDPGDWGIPWCYTTDPSIKWQVCKVAKCIL